MSLEEPESPTSPSNYAYLDLLTPEELSQNAIQIFLKPKKDERFEGCGNFNETDTECEIL